MSFQKIEECRKCINTTANPTIKIGKDGLCSVCHHYSEHFDPGILQNELKFFLSLIGTGKSTYDVMVGLSGGKDSTATLFSVKEMGFTPLAFTFRIGYIDKHVFDRAQQIASNMGVDHEIIDVQQYVGASEKRSFALMAELYDEDESPSLRDKFIRLYEEGRKYYSTKYDVVFPFVRPCQICRKIAIKAYYSEARKRGINVVVLGINEWAGLSSQSYSAVRALKPYKDEPAVYIVHLPYLLQRTLPEVEKIVKQLGWEPPKSSGLVETGASACLLARACEDKAKRLLGFHLDSTRLAREVTVGFITKEQALSAIEHTWKPEMSVREVLRLAGIIE